MARALEPSQLLDRVSPAAQRVLRLFVAEASAAVTADVLQAAAGVRVQRGVERLAPQRLLPLLLFGGRGFRDIFGYLVGPLAVNSYADRSVVEVRLHIYELLVEQLDVERLGERRLQVCIQSEHEGRHSNLRGLEGQELDVAKHEAAQVDGGRVDQVGVFVVKHMIEAKQALESLQELQRRRPNKIEFEGLENLLFKVNQILARHVPFLPSIYHVDHVYESGYQGLIQLRCHEQADDRQVRKKWSRLPGLGQKRQVSVRDPRCNM